MSKTQIVLLANDGNTFASHLYLELDREFSSVLAVSGFDHRILKYSYVNQQPSIQIISDGAWCTLDHNTILIVLSADSAWRDDHTFQSSEDTAAMFGALAMVPNVIGWSNRYGLAVPRRPNELDRRACSRFDQLGTTSMHRMVHQDIECDLTTGEVNSRDSGKPVLRFLFVCGALVDDIGGTSYPGDEPVDSLRYRVRRQLNDYDFNLHGVDVDNRGNIVRAYPNPPMIFDSKVQFSASAAIVVYCHETLGTK